MSVETALHGHAGRARVDRLQGLGFLTLTAVCWGLNWPVTKTLLQQLPPFSMRMVCSIVGVSFAFGLAAVRGERLGVPRGQWRTLLISSMLNFGAFSILTTLTLVLLRASEGVIITYTMPIWAALLAWPMLGERPTVKRMAALGLGLGGVALMVGADSIEASWVKLPGVLCGFAAAWLFALGTLFSKRHPLAMPPVAAVAWQALIGTLPMFVPAWFETPNWAGVTPLGWSAAAYVAIVPITVAYLAWFRALKLLPAAIASTGVLLSPIVGVIASGLVLGEPLGARQLLAVAITLTGVALAART
jgi:drug/metabolite transporter (DMT)-like permease